jgi:hypothetical protein
VFVDDLPTNVEAAERFGWRGVVYRPDGTLADKLRSAGVGIGTTEWCLVFRVSVFGLDAGGRARSRHETPNTNTEEMDILQQADPEVFAAVAAERHRQQVGLEMIASENYTSPAVMAAQGSCLTNKYAEGYPGKRYYGGCEHVDVVERLAIDRAKRLFGADHANVQPHSGRRRTWPCSSPRCSPATRSWGSTWRTAGTSPTGCG